MILFLPGFAAVDLTVMCMTEVMWYFVLQDNRLLNVVLNYTIKFLLTPVSLVERLIGWGV